MVELHATMLDRWELEKARASGRSAGRFPLPEGNRSREGHAERREPARKRTKLDFSFLGQLKPLSANLERIKRFLPLNWSQDQKGFYATSCTTVLSQNSMSPGGQKLSQAGTSTSVSFTPSSPLLERSKSTQKPSERWKYVMVVTEVAT
ncbi:hypothetical protein BDR05DRAFT_963651, partial [Suillus weaverae]